VRQEKLVLVAEFALLRAMLKQNISIADLLHLMAEVDEDSDGMCSALFADVYIDL
jgi:hypothetical protein